jgi:DNA-binding transcriptional regulator YiaG
MSCEGIVEEDPADYRRLYNSTAEEIHRQMVEEYNISHKESPITSPILAQDVRKKLGQTQSALAFLLGIPVATLQSWERNPSLMGSAAQVLLMLLEREPESAQRALRAIKLDPGGPRYPESDYGVWPAPVQGHGASQKNLPMQRSMAIAFARERRIITAASDAGGDVEGSDSGNGRTPK